MIKILKYLRKKEWLFVLASAVLIAFQVFLDLKLPDYMTEMTNKVRAEGSGMADVMTPGWKMLLCALGSLASSVAVAVLASRIASNFSMRLRRLQYAGVQEFSMKEMNSFSTASLITRSTNDITQVQMIIAMGLQAFIKAPITAIWAVTKIMGKGLNWTLATAGAVVLLTVMIGAVIVFAVPKFKKIQRMTDNINRVTRENLTGLRVVRAYNAEKYEENKFAKANEELTTTYLFTGRIMAMMMPGMNLIMNGLSLSIFWIGVYLINAAGSLQSKGELFSDMVVFMVYAIQVVMAFVMLSMIFIMLPRASVAAKRIWEVIDTKPSVTDGKAKVIKTKGDGGVEFRNVFFKYPDAGDYVLKDISFSAKKGETVAFIGATGSGKSTLMNLLPRFYDVNKGSILVDGVDVREYSQKELHNKIGYVPQQAVLFRGTVRENVAYGDNGRGAFTEEAVKEAVEIAQGKEFVENMPQGYDGEIAQGGANLSGGQKQRLSIARAVCRKPDIYIFDDTFSALDYRTDKKLRTALKAHTRGAVTFMVSQRIGTVKDADRILVLDQGGVAGAGTHAALMQSCKIYREIAESQLSKEELA